MKKIFARTGFILACGLAASASANYNITLNDTNLSFNVNGQACQLVSGSGQPVSEVAVNRNGSSATVSVTTAGEARLSCVDYVPGQPISSSSSSVASSSSSSSSVGGGTPAPGVDLSACGGLWPNGVAQGANMSLLGEVRKEQSLVGNSTISFPVQTLNANTNGRVIINGLSTTLTVGRDVWISQCPGGPAVQAGNCFGNSMESTTLRYWQGGQGGSPTLYCNLESNKQYFINVQNTSCSTSNRSCGFYRTIK